MRPFPKSKKRVVSFCIMSLEKMKKLSCNSKGLPSVSSGEPDFLSSKPCMWGSVFIHSIMLEYADSTLLEKLQGICERVWLINCSTGVAIKFFSIFHSKVIRISSIPERLNISSSACQEKLYLKDLATVKLNRCWLTPRMCGLWDALSGSTQPEQARNLNSGQLCENCGASQRSVPCYC